MLPTTMPRLERGSVELRAFELRDVPLVIAAGSDPLIPLITTVPRSGEERDAVDYVERQQGRLREGAGYSFTIVDTSTREAVGQIGLWTRELERGRASVGYWIAAPFRRRGYVTEALLALTEWALTHDQVQRIQLFVEPWNEGSWRAAEACGYGREGLLRRWEPVGDELRDVYVYSVVRRHA